MLYETVEVCADQRWSPALVRLLLDTLQPLVATASGWMVLETDPDPTREFLIQRSAGGEVRAGRRVGVVSGDIVVIVQG